MGRANVKKNCRQYTRFTLKLTARQQYTHLTIEFIRALVTYEATDALGLRNAFEESINDYLDMCKNQDIEPETPFKGSLNVRLGPDLHRRVALAAERNHSTINKFITQALDQILK